MKVQGCNEQHLKSLHFFHLFQNITHRVMGGVWRYLWRSPSPTFCSEQDQLELIAQVHVVFWVPPRRLHYFSGTGCPEISTPSQWISVFLCLNEGFYISIYVHCFWSFFWAEGKALNSFDLLAMLYVMQPRTLCTILARVHLVHQDSQVFLLEFLCVSYALVH